MLYFDFLYFNDERTGLMPGDQIKWAPTSNKITFYRNGERILIGESRDDAMALIEFRIGVFISLVAKISGFEPVPSTKYSSWILADN